MTGASGQGFHPLRALRAWLGASGAPRGLDRLDLKGINTAYVDGVKTQMPHHQAMEYAIGSNFESVGRMEAALVRHYGLAPDGYLIDVGCGSGRLAKPLSAYLMGRYLGVDLVPDLIDYAKRICQRPDWRFEVIDHIGVPERDGVADMVCFFSVLTHLLHEQSYWYLEEARRVLKPGGRIVFSFLEMRDPVHWQVFMDTMAASKARTSIPLNVFLDRAWIALWAEKLGMTVEDIRAGDDPVVPEGSLGQALCVLRKAA